MEQSLPLNIYEYDGDDEQDEGEEWWDVNCFLSDEYHGDDKQDEGEEWRDVNWFLSDEYHGDDKQDEGEEWRDVNWFLSDDSLSENEVDDRETLHDFYDSEVGSFDAPTETFDWDEQYVSEASDATASGQSSSGDTDYDM